MTGHAHHQDLHADIIRRLEWANAGILTELTARRAWRQIRWAIGDHLRCCHGARRLGFKTPVARLAELHHQLHQALKR
jgi:hypothetical protein